MRRRPMKVFLAAVVSVAVLVSGSVATAAADPVLEKVVRDADGAKSPFPSITETRVRVGAQKLRVVIADEDPERSEGLRERSDIGPYDGMLFVFDQPTSTAFTMSTVPVPLEIGFYDARGKLVDRLHMAPCAGSDFECTVYQADGQFTYALETLTGDLPKGRIRPARG